MFIEQLMTFTVRFLIAAWAVFIFFVTEHLDFGAANLPVAFGACVLAMLLTTVLEPRVQHILRIRIDSDRRIYINDIPYYRIVLATTGVVILFAVILLVTGQLGSFVHDLFRLNG